MAADTRDPSTPSSNVPPEDGERPKRKKPKHDFPKTQAGKLWEAFGNPEEPVNLMPGGTYNSAGGKPREATFMDGIKTMPASQMTQFYKTPCARDSLLTGIGAGFGVGGLRAILGGGLSVLWPAANWTAASFCVTAFGMHEFCRWRSRNERDGMKQAVQLMAQLKEKKKLQEEQEGLQREAKQEAERRAEQERQRKSWTNMSNYKFW